MLDPNLCFGKLKRDTDYTVTAAFADANAGDDKTVTVAVTLLDTDMAKNYAVSNSPITATADIPRTPRPGMTSILAFGAV